jgi:4-amino-4-deoxy-L-arabinose transferase-like glycosyltransferase
MDTAASPLPRPALVTRAAAARLPRWALVLFCAAYLLPGLFGRDPWRGADLAAFGQMLAIAEGRSPWLTPVLGGVATDAALLPHWLGAAAIVATQPWLDPALAARLPFALLLALALAGTWYATFHLARSDAAQPLPLAFGGEAAPLDYARAMADAALLALLATLGLLQLGHEATPELAQLAVVAGLLWAVAADGWRARAGALLLLPALAACGAPTMALVLGLTALALALTSQATGLRPLSPWLALATVLAALAAWPVHSFAWRVVALPEPLQLTKLWLWFLWPAWPLALWTLWRWRQHLLQRHLAVPGWTLAVALAASVGMGGSDRALMLGLPGLAVLAAFALPTLQRGTAAALDWFSVFFFSLAALFIWVMAMAMLTGIPARPAANIARLLPGFEMRPVPAALLLALAGTLLWLALVRWRTGRHRSALWKSLVLPAGGVALCWLLLMTLWLPLLDHGRSNRPLVQRLKPHLPEPGACVAAPGASPSLVAALEFHGRWRVDASAGALRSTCERLLLVLRASSPPAGSAAAQAAVQAGGWKELARVRRPTDRQEWTVVYRRAAMPVR